MQVFNRPKKLTDDERKELYHQTARANRANEFLASNFWKYDVAPYLKKEEESCNTTWKPGMEPDINKVASQVFFNSGMKAALIKFRQDLGVWLEQGENAAKELARDNVIFGEAVK